MLSAMAVLIAVSVIYIMPMDKSEPLADPGAKKDFTDLKNEQPEDSPWAALAPKRAAEKMGGDGDPATLAFSDVDAERTPMTGGKAGPEDAFFARGDPRAVGRALDDASSLLAEGESASRRQDADEIEEDLVKWLEGRGSGRRARPTWSPSIGQEEWLWDELKDERVEIASARDESTVDEIVAMADYEDEEDADDFAMADGKLRGGSASTGLDLAPEEPSHQPAKDKKTDSAKARARAAKPTAKAKGNSKTLIASAKKAESKGDYAEALDLYKQALDGMGYGKKAQKPKKSSPGMAMPAPPASAERSEDGAGGKDVKEEEKVKETKKSKQAGPSCSPALKEAVDGAVRCSRRLLKWKTAYNIERWYRKNCR